MLKAAFIGPPLSGKTTLFKALTYGHSQTGKSSAGHVEIHRGVVKVPNEKLLKLAEFYSPKKVSPVEIEYFDLVGSLESEKKQEGEKTAILRECDELIAVAGLFQEMDLEQGLVAAQGDLQKLFEDLLVLDYVQVEKKLEKSKKPSKGPVTAQGKLEIDLLEKCRQALEKQIPCRKVTFTHDEEKLLRGYALLTSKPILIILNINERMIPRTNEIETRFSNFAKSNDSIALAISGEMELELSQLTEEERPDFMKELGIAQPASDRVAFGSYQLMKLISFYTANQNEVRVWALPRGNKAIQAAGIIHSDMEKGFIKAEIINIDELFALGSMHAAKEKGAVGLEGKEYVVQEGDVIFFRFNP